MVIIYPLRESAGWTPISYLVRLAAELLDAEVIDIDAPRKPTRWQQCVGLLGRRRGKEPCLVICPDATDCRVMSRIPGWNRRFSTIAAWVIDSFWPDRVNRITRTSRFYDHLYVMTAEDVPTWQRMMGVPVRHLAWGSDVWRLGSGAGVRPWDVMRIGRQPPEWDDNRATEAECAAAGLRFAGPPAFVADQVAGQKSLHAAYASAKYLLAFSNIASPASYTHPTRQYLTARWADALACGTVVAGIAPRAPDIDRLLWPGATLELPDVSRANGMPVLQQAVAAWRPEIAAHNHRMALQRLDWRWRLLKIADDLELPAPKLRAELQALKTALAAPALVNPPAASL